MNLFEDEDSPKGNQPEFTVSELSGAVKRVIEGEFGLVRVRGEIGRVSRPSSGHLYYDLKDDRSVIAAITWKGQAARLSLRPEEGMEVIATGRMTTFPGQSKYQLIIDDLVPAGAGALMAMLEKRRQQLAAEGLFDAARKRAIPFLPGVIGVVTSPSGAVIRDILHRLRDRFPRHVLIWPVAVQGEKCAPEVASAIRGFNAIAPGGPIPRPDLLIVARGGGSLEDLWGFNEEIVVRAAADSAIPLISAVGHETDTTLIDHAADRRAPTPTAAAEMAVPVRLELLAQLDGQGARLGRGVVQLIGQRGQRLRDLARALPRPEGLTQAAAQRLDLAGQRLGSGLGLAAARKRHGFEAVAAKLSPALLRGALQRRADRVEATAAKLGPAIARRIERRQDALGHHADRLQRAFARLISDSARATARHRQTLDALGLRLEAAIDGQRLRAADRLGGLERMRQTLGYTETLKRGYAVVRAEGVVLTSRLPAATATALEIEFHDGRLALAAPGVITAAAATPSPARQPGPHKSAEHKSAEPRSGERKPRKPAAGEGQGSLF